MAFSPGTILLCHFPVDGVESTPGFEAMVELCDGAKVVARCDAGAVSAADAGRPVEVRYIDPKDARFLGMVGRVSSVEGDGTAVTMVVTGKARVVNQREDFRVSTRCTDIRADVGDWGACTLLDVSAGGVSVRVRGAPEQGQVCAVTVHGWKGPIAGTFVVRHVVDEGGGVWRCGLQTTPGSTIGPRLAALAMDVQRAQLRRRSRIAEPGHAGTPGAGDAGQEDGATTAAEVAGVAGGAPDHVSVRIPASMLAGRPLPGTLRDDGGKIVAARGDVLSEGDLASLVGSELVVCDDWFGNGQTPARGDRRKNARAPCRQAVGVWVVGPDGVRAVRAELVDVSRGGLALTTPAVVHPGETVMIEFKRADFAGWIVGRVAYHTVPAGSVVSRVGVRFSQGGIQRTPMPDTRNPGEVAEALRGIVEGEAASRRG